MPHINPCPLHPPPLPSPLLASFSPTVLFFPPLLSSSQPRTPSVEESRRVNQLHVSSCMCWHRVTNVEHVDVDLHLLSEATGKRHVYQMIIPVSRGTARTYRHFLFQQSDMDHRMHRVDDFTCTVLGSAGRVTVLTIL